MVTMWYFWPVAAVLDQRSIENDGDVVIVFNGDLKEPSIKMQMYEIITTLALLQ